MLLKFQVKVFKAIENNILCEKFIKGHKEVLEIFGITEITSANIEWFTNPNSYVLIAENTENGNIVGGARIHVAGGTQLLPIEDAVGSMDSNIHKIIKDLAPNGTGELCGLWNSREVAGMGISTILTRAAISVAKQLELNTLFIICAERTFENIFIFQGFELVITIGNNGTFYYPKSDLKALSLMIKNTLHLDLASNYDKSIISDLFSDPVQEKKNEGSENNLTIVYNLKLTQEQKIYEQL